MVEAVGALDQLVEVDVAAGARGLDRLAVVEERALHDQHLAWRAAPASGRAPGPACRWRTPARACSTVSKTLLARRCAAPRSPAPAGRRSSGLSFCDPAHHLVRQRRHRMERAAPRAPTDRRAARTTSPGAMPIASMSSGQRCSSLMRRSAGAQGRRRSPPASPRAAASWSAVQRADAEQRGERADVIGVAVRQAQRPHAGERCAARPRRRTARRARARAARCRPRPARRRGRCSRRPRPSPSTTRPRSRRRARPRRARRRAPPRTASPGSGPRRRPARSASTGTSRSTPADVYQA